MAERWDRRKASETAKQVIMLGADLDYLSSVHRNTWWEERMDFHKVSFDFSSGTVACLSISPQPYPNIHNK